MIGEIYNQPSTVSARTRIRLLVILEGNTVTGPAKNLLEFCRVARNLKQGPMVEMSLVLFQRPDSSAAATQPGSSELLQQALRYGIPVYCISEGFTFDWRVLSSLNKLIARLAPDVIQTHGFKSHFLVRACGARAGRAWVAFHHGYTRSTRKRDLLAQLDRWSLQSPSQVVTVSQAFARQLCSRGVPSSRIMVLHNAIDPDWCRKPDTQDSGAAELIPWMSGGEKLVLAVGRLSKEKAFPDLVAAVGRLKETRPDLSFKLAIVGEGLERGNIEEAVRRAGLEKQVHLVGHVNDVRPYYRAADLLAISSLSEGSPNALLEAMAAGVPVVSTDVGGIPEIVSHRQTAFLVSAQDSAALADAIGLMLSDRALAEDMARRARELISTQYSPLCRAESLIRLYERLCPQTNPTQDSESGPDMRPKQFASRQETLIG
jgi:glycosyltransferase involved in cell wall biosynthesis